MDTFFQCKKYPLIQNSMVYLGVLVLFLSLLLFINDKLYVLSFFLNNTISNDYISFSSKIIIGAFLCFVY